MTDGHLEVYESAFAKVFKPSQRWRWRLRASNGRLVAESGEGYTNRDECIRMAGRVMGGDYATALQRFT